jgi:serine/threonine protein kinase
MAELYTLKPLFQGSSETDQLFKICSVLGTPNAQNWPDGQRLAARLGIRLPQFNPVSLSSIIPNASPEAIDLMTELLRYDPGKRLNAIQALQHPFFKGEKVAVSRPVKAAAEEERPRPIQLNSRLKDDEVERVPVRAIEPVAPQGVAQRRRPIAPVADQEIDDIFDGIL